MREVAFYFEKEGNEMIVIDSNLWGLRPSNLLIFPKACTRIYQRCICSLWGWSILNEEYDLIGKIILVFMMISIMFWGKGFIKRGNLIGLFLLNPYEKYESFLCLIL